MKHKTIFSFLLLSMFAICNAQKIFTQKDNAISLELGKSGLIYNLNFDHLFRNKNFGFRLLAGSNFSKNVEASVAGGGAYYLIGRKTNFFELGADLDYLSVKEISNDQRGILLLYPDYTVKTFYASANIGYRRYGKKSLFRIGLSPGFIKNDFLPGAYLSFGFVF